jgi:hypothetical protein
VIYKIISKDISNRLKPLLPLLISQEKSSLVEGRQILDKFIMAHELIHSLKTFRKLGMIIKLDMSKS